MRVHSTGAPAFRPVTVTVETVEEFDKLRRFLGMANVEMEDRHDLRELLPAGLELYKLLDAEAINQRQLGVKGL